MRPVFCLLARMLNEASFSQAVLQCSVACSLAHWGDFLRSLY